MKVILDIKDSKADALMDVLDDLPYVKAKLLKKKKKEPRLLRELREAVEEMKDIYAGKKEGRDIQHLLNELQD